MKEESIHIISILKLCGVEASAESSTTNSHQRKILTYPNPDGTIRWMWDAESTQPLFLKFYGVIGWKSKLFSAFVKSFFAFNIQRKLSKQTIDIFLDNKNLENYKAILGNEWALFTGTPGKLRKAVVVIQNKSESVFLKIPLTKASEEIVSVEYKNLFFLQQLELKSSVVPVGKMQGKSLQQTDLSQLCNSRSALFGNAHYNSLIEFFEKIKKFESLESTTFWQKIERNISYLIEVKPHVNILIWDELLKNLLDTKNTIDKSNQHLVGIAHADLTAWNCYCNNEKLFIYDWELAIHDAPVLYDLFHFHIQGNCLLGNQSFEQIDEKLNQVLNSKVIKSFCNKNSIDVLLNLKLYLLYHVSESLCWYSEQKDLHLQVQWLTSLWNKYLTQK